MAVWVRSVVTYVAGLSTAAVRPAPPGAQIKKTAIYDPDTIVFVDCGVVFVECSSKAATLADVPTNTACISDDARILEPHYS